MMMDRQNRLQSFFLVSFGAFAGHGTVKQQSLGQGRVAQVWLRNASWICALCIPTLTGCHPLNWGSRDELAPFSQFDDSESPPVPILGRNANRGRTAMNGNGFETSSAQPGVSQRMQRLAASRELAKGESLNSKSILDTSTPDADLDEALKNLSPEMQALLKKQMEAMQQLASRSVADEAHASKNAGVVAKINDSEDEEDDAPIADVKLGRPIGSVVASKPPRAIRMSLKDSSTDDSESNAVQPASASGADLQNSVDRAVAESSPIDEDWHESLSETIAKLEKEIADSPAGDEQNKLNKQAVLRILYLADGKLNESLKAIDGLQEHEREYFQHQLQAIHAAIDPNGIPVRIRRWSMVMDSQRKATEHLASISNLEVKAIHFCDAVDGYGMINKFPSYSFKPEQQVLLYCELENVSADQIKDGFETQLQGSYEVVDKKGSRITSQILPMIPEICKNRRRDYYVVYPINMPSDIRPGNYQLTLSIEDMKGHKVGSSNVDFQIGK